MVLPQEPLLVLHRKGKVLLQHCNKDSHTLSLEELHIGEELPLSPKDCKIPYLLLSSVPFL